MAEAKLKAWEEESVASASENLRRKTISIPKKCSLPIERCRKAPREESVSKGTYDFYPKPIPVSEKRLVGLSVRN